MSEKSIEKSTSEQLSELLKQLSKDQLRYVVAFQDYPSKKDAAEAVGIKPNTVYNWPDVVDVVAQMMAMESADSALAIRRRNVVKAMMVKVTGLDSNDERIRQNAATEIIEGELGKAGQKVDLTTGGEKIESVSDEKYNRAIATLADAIREKVPGKDSEQDGEMVSTE